jgi:hypothetical protein
MGSGTGRFLSDRTQFPGRRPKPPAAVERGDRKNGKILESSADFAEFAAETVNPGDQIRIGEKRRENLPYPRGGDRRQ